MSDSLTLEEQEKILLVAKALLKEPDSWVQGTWRCPAFKSDANGYPIFKDGKGVQKTDANGNPLFQYCIEGAVNQAAYNVLGEDRVFNMLTSGVKTSAEMKKLQMAEGGDSASAALSGGRVADHLGLNKIAQELYGTETAMEYNDANTDEDECAEFNGTHEGVLEILNRRLAEVQKRLRPS